MSFFSSNLKLLREKRGISRSEMASKINVNQSTISRWENGEMGVTVENAYDIAKYFNISIADLTGKDLSLEKTINQCDELETLFDKHKDILTESDKQIIKTIIEERRKATAKQLGIDND